MAVNTTFPDSTYTSSNKPSAATLKSDISALETEINTIDAAVTKNADTDVSSNSWVIDEDDMSSNSDEKVPTQQSVKAYCEAMWPVGSVYVAVVATNPGTLLGFGTWSRIAEGQMLIGQKTSDADFDTAEETGGAKTHTLTTDEMPSHTHTQNAHTHTQNAHTHTQDEHRHTSLETGGTTLGWAARITTGENSSITAGGTSIRTAYATATNQNATAVNQNATATNQETGGGSAHSIMNPYFVAYMWKRTA